MLFLLSLADTGRIATSHTKRDTEVGGNELKNKGTLKVAVRHVAGNDQDYLRKIPRVVVQKSALL